MLPADLVKLIKSYLNSKNILLLTDLVDYINILSTILILNPSYKKTDYITALFTQLGFKTTIVDNYSFKVDYNNDVDKHLIVYFVDMMMEFIRVAGLNIVDISMSINKILYKYKFNKYLFFLYNDENEKIYHWC